MTISIILLLIFSVFVIAANLKAVESVRMRLVACHFMLTNGHKIISSECMKVSDDEFGKDIKGSIEVITECLKSFARTTKFDIESFGPQSWYLDEQLTSMEVLVEKSPDEPTYQSRVAFARNLLRVMVLACANKEIHHAEKGTDNYMAWRMVQIHIYILTFRNFNDQRYPENLEQTIDHFNKLLEDRKREFDKFKDTSTTARVVFQNHYANAKYNLIMLQRVIDKS